MEKQVTLSSNEFKALASETRADIIKLLKQRNHTLSEISKKLDMAAPTIKQHLSVLQGAEIIEVLEEGRKWKYYTLTRKGRSIFSEETPTNILIVLGATVVALAASLYWFLPLLERQAMFMAPEFDSIAKAPPVAEAGGNIVQAMPTLTVEPVLLLSVIVALSLFAGFLAARLKWKHS